MKNAPEIILKSATKLAVVTAFNLALFSGLCAEVKAQQKQTALQISKETTYLTEPLNKHGFVDFLAAANQRFSRSVNATNNFEVAIRKIMPADEISESIRAEYFKRLGIEIPNQNGVCSFQKSFFRYAHSLTPDADLMTWYNATQGEPWMPQDYPVVEKWLVLERKRLDQLVAACNLPYCYTPYLIEADQGNVNFPLIMTLLPGVMERRDLGRALQIRIYRNIGVHDLEIAWTDTLAGLKMARLTGSGFSLIELLVGAALDAMMFDAATRIISSDALPDELANRILSDLKELNYLPNSRVPIDFAERATAIDVVQVLSRQKDILQAINVLNGLVEGPTEAGPKAADDSPPGQSLSEQFDFNQTAKTVNFWYDRISEAVGEEDFAKRKQLLARLKSEMPDPNTSNILGQMLIAKDRVERGETIGEIVLCFLTPSFTVAANAQLESSERLDILRMASACQVYRRKHAAYPEKLEQLVPDHLDSIPADRLSPNPIQYRRRHNGFVVYSAGRNGKDDLGRGRDDVGERQNATWDDVVIRVKRSR